MSKIEYVFLDGGHDYDTVKNDLNNCIEVIENRGTVLCDDYNLSYAPGVKQAIDEFIEKNRFNYEILFTRVKKFRKLQRKSEKKRVLDVRTFLLSYFFIDGFS